MSKKHSEKFHAPSFFP